MLNRHSETGEEIDFAVAEFCILPVYRRGHRGEWAMRRIFETHKGCWEIKYNRGNPPAEKFWDRVTAPYKRRITSLEDGDQVISFRSDN